MLATAVGAQLPHMESAYSISVRAATGQPPNEVQPLLPLIDHQFVTGHQGLEHDHGECCDLDADK